MPEKTIMENLLALLFQARDVAHVQHWKVKSLSLHLALGELYETLLSFADELAEMAMGDGVQLGDIQHDAATGWDKNSPHALITQLHQGLAELKSTLPQKDWLINKYEELQADVAKIKYKIENLH